MDALLVMMFEDEAGALAGARLLRRLHAECTLTLYAAAVVARVPRGPGVVVREPVAEGEGAAAPSVGAAVGALVSLLGGPVTTMARMLASGLVDAVRDLDDAGLDARFLEQISRDLPPGGGAVIAEAEEGRPLRLNAQAAVLRGRVFRHRLTGALSVERMIGEVALLRSELAEFRTKPRELQHAAALRELRQSRAAELGRAVKRAEALAVALRREGAAKVAVLRAQAARLEGEARIAVEHRAATVRAALEARAARLDGIAESFALAWPAVARSGRRPNPSGS